MTTRGDVEIGRNRRAPGGDTLTFRRRRNNLCVMWPRYSSDAFHKSQKQLLFFSKKINFVLFFSPLFSCSCLRGESQRRGGFLPEGECSARPRIMSAAAPLGCVQEQRAERSSPGRAADVRCSRSHSQLPFGANKNMGTTVTPSHCRDSDPPTQLTQHCRLLSLT